MASRTIFHGAPLRSFILGLLVIVALFALDARYPRAVELAELKASDLRMYARPGRKPLGVAFELVKGDKPDQRIPPQAGREIAAYYAAK